MNFFTCVFSKSGDYRVTFIVCLLLASIVSGCGDKNKQGQTSQVAVKVNSVEITVSQLNSALNTMTVPAGKTPEAAKKEVLNSLVVQSLAVQQAVKMKLDHDPAVEQLIENAKNSILARAYLDPIISGVAKLSSDDVHKFYIDHPELFSDRHIYTIRELQIESKPDVKEAVIELINAGKTEDAIAAWAKTKNVKTTVQSEVKSSEQLPLDLLVKLSKMATGKKILVDMGTSLSVLAVTNLKSEPVSESIATNAIQEYLNNIRKKEAMENEIKSLKAAAKIEYFGEFNPG